MPELPLGTVTFLFTDIESSTDLVRRLGTSYPDLLANHRRLLRQVFARHEGREIDTQGDAFFVAFERARDAVLAGASAQRAIEQHKWAAAAPRIRVGLHTTEPIPWEEGYVGVGVHRANRICAAGHGGQVLLSRSTAGLVADEELEGLGLLDLGQHRLKGLDDPERIFQLAIEGLQNDFPPLNTIEGAGPGTETLTVLMTDLEGLTRRLHELAPEQFRRLISDYHRTLHRVLAESGGAAISSFGDSAIAVFRSARRAVVAAAGLQQTVEGHSWPSGVAMRVSICLDAGEVIATAYGPFGEAVNRCAALSVQARGGQTLISESARSLLDGEDLGELELLELAERVLTRGGRPIRIYELIVPGIPPDSSLVSESRTEVP
jgi:class 3 adenylate cyclase